MFTQPCFIRKNTPELRNKLEELGYVSHIFNNNDANNIYVDKFGTYISVDIENPPGYIDCGNNEELFLALAALRNDSDKYQWFICQEEYISTHTMEFIKVGTWQINTQFDKLTYSLKHLWRKASVQELIEHFKEK